MRDHFTTAELAALLGVEAWQVRRVFQRGELTEPPRFGGKRAIPREMIGDVLEALHAHGWGPRRPNEPSQAAG